MAISELAGKVAPQRILTNIPLLLTQYYEVKPDADNPAQQVAFGTSGHRGSSLDGSFTEAQIMAVSQAVAEYRAAAGIHGPLFIGADTHALSEPALASALRKLEIGVAQAPLAPTQKVVDASHMMIANPFRAQDVSRLMSTHPPMGERIARLEQMAYGYRANP